MHQTACTVFDCTDPAAPRPVAGFALGADGHGLIGYGKRYVLEEDAFAPEDTLANGGIQVAPPVSVP